MNKEEKDQSLTSLLKTRNRNQKRKKQISESISKSRSKINRQNIVQDWSDQVVSTSKSKNHEIQQSRKQENEQNKQQKDSHLQQLISIIHLQSQDFTSFCKNQPSNIQDQAKVDDEWEDIAESDLDIIKKIYFEKDEPSAIQFCLNHTLLIPPNCQNCDYIMVLQKEARYCSGHTWRCNKCFLKNKLYYNHPFWESYRLPYLKYQ